MQQKATQGGRERSWPQEGKGRNDLNRERGKELSGAKDLNRERLQKILGRKREKISGGERP